MLFENQRILVVGGFGLIGNALRKTIEREGGSTILTTRDPQKVKHFNQKTDKSQSKSRAIKLSFETKASVERQIKTLLEDNKPIDGYVHNAYMKCAFKPVGSIPWNYWEESIRVSVAACETISSLLITNINKTKLKSVVNVSSIYGAQAPQFFMYDKSTQPNPIYYGAIKSSVNSLTKYLAAYYGPQGIRFNTISPAGINNGQESSFLKRYNATVPMERMVEPSEVCEAISFLLSAKASGITGQNLFIDAGKTLW